MLGKMLIGGVIAIAALAGSAGTGHAGLNVDLGIHFRFPPQLAPVPASPVFYAPSVSANLFSYDREFFVFRGGVWYVGPGHNGPWTSLPPRYVPRPILAVPVRYYRERPREWAHWRHEAPPRWSPAWGQRWEVRRAEHRAISRDERRSDRHAAYRDDRRGAPQPAYRDRHRDEHRGDHHERYRDDRR